MAKFKQKRVIKMDALTGVQFGKLFQDEFDRLIRKVERYRALKAGELGIRKIWVRGSAPHHRARGADHWRIIPDRKTVKQATKLRVINGGKK